MEGLDECRRLYFKLMSMELENKLFSCDTKRENRDWASLKKNLRDVLTTLQLSQKFRHSIFDSLLHEKFIKHQPKWDYELVARAFGHLETYCRILRAYPWKTEYHTLKTYGGFFSTYIHSVLPSCMLILKIIGYSPISQGTQGTQAAEGPAKPMVLKLNSLPNVALLETIGFDCLAASLECEIRLESMQLMYNKLSNLQLDEIVTGTMPDKVQRRHYIPLTDKKRITSLPRELEAYPRLQTSRSELIRSTAKSKTYHFEKLHLYQKRQNMFSDEDDSNCHATVSFNRRGIALAQNPGKVDFTTSDHETPRTEHNYTHLLSSSEK